MADVYMDDKGIKRVRIPGEEWSPFVQKNDEGYEFYRILNPYKPSGIAHKSFSYCIYDAIRAVREGHADVVLGSKGLFSNTIISVVKYLDSTYGMKQKEECLKSWENTTFGWSILVNGSLLCENLVKFTPFMKVEEQQPILFFEKEQDAIDLFEKIKKVAKDAVTEYSKLTDGDEQSKFISDFSDKYGDFSAYTDFFYDYAFQEEGQDTCLNAKVIQHIKS